MDGGLPANEIFSFLIIGTAVVLGLAVALIVLFNISRQKILEQKTRRQAELLAHREELLNSTLLTQETERRRIARELHDAVGSKMSVLRLALYRLRKLPLGDDGEKVVMDMQALIDDTIGTARGISHQLLPPVLEEFGLPAALRELCESYQTSGEVTVVTDIDNLLYPLPEDMTLHLYRIAQELLKNSVTHGRAKHITTSLKIEPNSCRLRVTDDGVGFDPEAVGQKGLGLQNLEFRVQMIKGRCQLHSQPGQGADVIISAPLTAAASTTVLNTSKQA